VSTKYDWHPGYMTSEHVKERVAGWAWGVGLWSVEEIASVCDGRLDLLLVPTSMDAPIFKQLRGHWTERLGLIGVEVKVDKQDFKNGLESKQFDRYAAGLSGLYIAGPPDVVDRKLVPDDYGIIHVGGHRHGKGNPPQPIVCRRHAKFEKLELTEEQHWRIIWAMAKSVHRFNREEREERQSLEKRIKEHAGDAIWAALKELEDINGKV
jgi:hypothetical protein